jgi:hypothetical protein
MIRIEYIERQRYGPRQAMDKWALKPPFKLNQGGSGGSEALSLIK